MLLSNGALNDNNSTYRVDEKYTTSSVQEIFGKPFYESKLWLISVVTLQTKVTFGKKEPLSLPHDLWRMPISIIEFFLEKLKSISVF